MVGRIPIPTLLVVVALPTFAQTQQPFAHRGLLSAAATIAPGWMLDQALTNIYVTGGFHLFLEDHVSLRGLAAWYIDEQQRSPLLDQNSRISFGPYYHFTFGRADVALGFEPGVSFAQLREPAGSDLSGSTPVRVVPNTALGASCTYYVWKYLHFFVEAHYLRSRYAGSSAGTLDLDELQAMAGLGWQVKVFGR